MLDKIYTGSYDQAVQDITEVYTSQGYCIVNYLYFANAMKWRLFEKPRDQHDKDYKSALQQGDFLLPDGIALQTFYRCASTTKQTLANLNGTDFTPKLLRYLEKKHTVSLYLYQCYDPSIGKEKESLQEGVDILQEMYSDIHVIWSDQCIYQERGDMFDRDKLTQTISQDTSEIKIFLHCTGTPYQEIRSVQHLDTIQKLGLLVINAGAFVDYLTGVEQRAPDRVVASRVLETPWRVLTNPKKNFGKFQAMFGIFRYFLTPK